MNGAPVPAIGDFNARLALVLPWHGVDHGKLKFICGFGH